MAIFKKGDKVKIENVGGVYTTYIRWIVEKAYVYGDDGISVRQVLPHYVYGRKPSRESVEGEWTVIAVGEHEECAETVALIDNGKEAYMFDSKYLIPAKDFLKWTDLKIGDCIKRGNKSNLVYMVTGIDSNEETVKHILVGNTWLFDEDLRHCVKVEGDTKC